jgi:pSer/pThr/pTyr-binding forkhead associated (FHA) protein
MLRLVVQPLPGSPREHLLERDEITIGRSRSCDVPLGSKFASREHARIVKTDDGWAIEDLGSRNGTVLNGEILNGPGPEGRHAITDGDVLHIAHYSIALNEMAMPSAAASQASQLSSSALQLSWH